MTTTTTSSTAERAATDRQAVVDGLLAQGEHIMGLKLSLTSADAQARLGTDRPIWGWLTGAMEVDSGHELTGADGPTDRRAEAELVFLLGADLAGPGVTSRDVLAATSAICAGLELPARYDGVGAPTADAMVARNALAAHFVVGAPRADWRHLDLSLLGVVLELDGEPVASGCTAVVMGHPAHAIATVVNDLAAHGDGLRAGQLIFTGGITPAVTLRPGNSVYANFAHLSGVGVAMAADA